MNAVYRTKDVFIVNKNITSCGKDSDENEKICMIGLCHLILLEKISVLCTMSSPEQTVYRLGQKIKALLFELENLKRQNDDLKDKLSSSFGEISILEARVQELERTEEQKLIAAAVG